MIFCLRAFFFKVDCFKQGKLEHKVIQFVSKYEFEIDFFPFVNFNEVCKQRKTGT